MLLALCTVIGLIAGGKMVQQSGRDKANIETVRADHGRELNEIVRFIEEKYVDDVDSEVLISSAISALLKDLDPHSGYLSPDEVRELNEKMEGRYEGIGIEFQRVLDTAIILYVVPGAPADKAGVKAYDRIVAANDSAMTSPHLTESDMVKCMREWVGKEVRLTVARRGVDTLIVLTMERDVIPVRSVETAYMIGDDIGYFKIRNFNARTYKEFMEHLERLVDEEGMRDLVIDLRQNPGGYLKEAVNILSQLFDEKGLLLVYTEGAHATQAEYRTTGKPFFDLENVVVLVDDGSASASEILAGALQDHDRGVVIGEPTFGKGLVQEQYALSNGGALRLTIARYYTPSGRLIQKPYENGEAVSENGQAADDTSAYYTTSGRAVSGSGGITPDILVDWDFDWHDKRMYGLYRDVLEYSFYGHDHSRKYESVDEIVQEFPSEEFIRENIIKYYSAPGRSDSLDADYILNHLTYARMLLMAMVASDHFGHDGWYKVMNHSDPVVQKALEVIKQDLQTTLKLD